MKNYRFGFTVYGVKVGIETNRKYLFDAIKTELPVLLPVEKSEMNFAETDRRFLIRSFGKEKFRVEIDNENDYSGFNKKNTIEYFLSHLRVKIAEYAEKKVFLHAGVVGWKGKAIIIPAQSFKGKTTLVAEFVKLGAEYYSDEYAVLDAEGLVHPFPKMISMRGIIDKYVQKDIPPENFGKIGKAAIPVGLVLFTEYIENAEFQPVEISVGQGVLEILSHTIPIRYRPEFSLSVLNKILSRAIILKSQRNEARDFAQKLLGYFDNNLK